MSAVISFTQVYCDGFDGRKKLMKKHIFNVSSQKDTLREREIEMEAERDGN